MGVETSTGKPSELNPAWPLMDDSKSEAPAHFQLIKNTIKTWATKMSTFVQGTITNQISNSVTCVGTGNDTLVPPTGYVAIPGFVEDLKSGEMSVASGAFVCGLDGVFEAFGWASLKSDTANVTVSIVFGVERAGVVTYSPRPTPVTLAQAGKLATITGGGRLKLRVGDKVRPYIASSGNAVITVPNANMALSWKMENPDA